MTWMNEKDPLSMCFKIFDFLLLFFLEWCKYQSVFLSTLTRKKIRREFWLVRLLTSLYVFDKIRFPPFCCAVLYWGKNRWKASLGNSWLTLKVPGFSLFLDSLLEDRVLHKEAWVAKLLGTHLSIQVHKKVKFSWRDNSPLALKGLRSKS